MAAFDTLSAARDLENAGLDRKQAEALAAIVRDLGQGGDLATKADLRRAAFGVVSANAAMTFTLLKLSPP